MYRTALGILRLSNEKFLNSGFEECVGILKQFGEQKVLNEKELFDSITNVTVQPYVISLHSIVFFLFLNHALFLDKKYNFKN